jgi:SIR2-like domain
VAAAAPLIDRLPRPLLEDIVRGRAVPFVGAGFSRNAAVPPGRAMPLWTELATALVAQISDYRYDGSPVDAISAYEQEYGRVRLVEELRRILLVGYASPGAAHEEFCRLPFDIVCTTNIEFLLDDGYRRIGQSLTVVTQEEQLSVGVDHRTTTLVKLHGDLDHPSQLIVTEADYDGFLTRNPLLVTFVSNLLITRTPLFIGYSIEDADFRQILAVVADRLGRMRRAAYVLGPAASRQTRARYERRGVRCVDIV